MEHKAPVKIGNDLTRASYSLTLNEKRLVMYAIAKGERVDSKINVLAIDCAAFYNMEKTNARKQFIRAMNSLWNREFVPHKNNSNLGFRWIITRSKYDTGIITLEFHPDLLQYLENLHERYTKYFLTRAANFKLFYSWRLFEILMQFRKTGVSKISVNDFVDQLELGENYRNDFYRLRVKVLEPALKEIRGKAELPVKMKTTKTGRKVTGLEFKFPVEQQKGLSLNKPKQTAKPKINNAYIEQHARPGETYEQARRRLEEEIKEVA